MQFILYLNYLITLIVLLVRVLISRISKMLMFLAHLALPANLIAEVFNYILGYYAGICTNPLIN